jgi:hypothetical protein
MPSIYGVECAAIHIFRGALIKSVFTISEE